MNYPKTENPDDVKHLGAAPLVPYGRCGEPRLAGQQRCSQTRFSWVPRVRQLRWRASFQHQGKYHDHTRGADRPDQARLA